MLGLLLKQLMGMSLPSSSQPYISTKWVTIILRVLPCSGSFDVDTAMIKNERYRKGQQKKLPNEIKVDEMLSR
jgi:hypothetical protein